MLVTNYFKIQFVIKENFKEGYEYEDINKLQEDDLNFMYKDLPIAVRSQIDYAIKNHSHAPRHVNGGRSGRNIKGYDIPFEYPSSTVTLPSSAKRFVPEKSSSSDPSAILQ